MVFKNKKESLYYIRFFLPYSLTSDLDSIFLQEVDYENVFHALYYEVHDDYPQ